jgi:hypothetical protein
MPDDNGQEVHDLARCIAIRQRGLSHQPFRDELLGELGSISRRMGVPLDRLKVGDPPDRSVSHDEY